MKRLRQFLLTNIFFLFVFFCPGSLVGAEKLFNLENIGYSGIYKSLKTKLILIKQKDKYTGLIYIKNKHYPLVAHEEKDLLKGSYGSANQVQFTAYLKDKLLVFNSDLTKDYLNFVIAESFTGIYKSNKIKIELREGEKENSVMGFLEYNNLKFNISAKISGGLIYGTFNSKDGDFNFYMILKNNKLTFNTGGFSSTVEKINTETDELKSFVHTEPAGMKFVYVAPGSFVMGSDDGKSNEQPAHKVTITNPYLISRVPITEDLFNMIMDGDSLQNYRIKSRFPVVNVTWYGAVLFSKKFTEYCTKHYNLPLEYEFRLPTEAEWEYAAKGGIVSSGFKYSGSNDADSVAWYRTNSGKKIQSIALKQPNELGVYDMSGNVLEWCQDWYLSRYPSGTLVNPRGIPFGKDKVIRGGGYINTKEFCRITNRSWDMPGRAYNNVGFRIVLAKKRVL